jgi:3-dehydroquinate dehydratase type I
MRTAGVHTQDESGHVILGAAVVCVSLGNRPVDAAASALRDFDFAEIRLDLIQPPLNELERLFTPGKRIIATCRAGSLTDEERIALLRRAIELGAAFVDVEKESPVAFKAKVMQAALSKGCKIIISSHDFEKTPPAEVLRSTIQQSFGEGADYVKIACMVNAPQDNATLLGLLSNPEWQQRLIVVGMGTLGRFSRIMGPLLGSPFTFASSGEGTETAPGQPTRQELLEIWKCMGVVT